jgi:hypothetical protein
MNIQLDAEETEGNNNFSSDRRYILKRSLEP